MGTYDMIDPNGGVHIELLFGDVWERPDSRNEAGECRQMLSVHETVHALLPAGACSA